MIEMLISGGQTGADRAALDVALRHGFPHGGWCPAGRRAEDGPIGGQYQLIETPSSDYLQRTEWNVRDSDGTVVFTFSVHATGGSLRTIEFAREQRKPHVQISRTSDRPAFDLQQFVERRGIKRLNVAGPRESEDPGMHRWVMEVIEDALYGSGNHPGVPGGPGEG